ncbi:MAG: HipA N-terminal domain-containing protein [Lachnospiraceae bacterium]|nr:HipA N-terminal domain-containing protein [Lachnospiraceae bacterium]
MSVAEVYLWGTRIGAVQQETVTSVPVFNYDSDFLRSGIEPAPLVMPLSARSWSFPALSEESFGDGTSSLPICFGLLPPLPETKIERQPICRNRSPNCGSPLYFH